MSWRLINEAESHHFDKHCRLALPAAGCRSRADGPAGRAQHTTQDAHTQHATIGGHLHTPKPPAAASGLRVLASHPIGMSEDTETMWCACTRAWLARPSPRGLV